MLMEFTLIVAWGSGYHPPVSLYTGRMVTFHTERRKTEREEWEEAILSVGGGGMDDE